MSEVFCTVCNRQPCACSIYRLSAENQRLFNDWESAVQARDMVAVENGRQAARIAELEAHELYIEQRSKALHEENDQLSAECSGSLEEIASLKRKLAAFETCLTAVRAERPEVSIIRRDRESSNPQQKHPGWQYAYDSQGTLLAYITDLERSVTHRENCLRGARVNKSLLSSEPEKANV